MRDYAAIIAELARAHDGFEAIVAHSFGTPGAALAIRSGIRVGKLVTINGAADFEYLLQRFAGTLGLTALERDGGARGAPRAGCSAGVTDDIWSRYSATAALPTEVPWLVIHDDADATIELAQAHALVEAHPHIHRARHHAWPRPQSPAARRRRSRPDRRVSVC